jgi:hypothetical protein
MLRTHRTFPVSVPRHPAKHYLFLQNLRTVSRARRQALRPHDNNGPLNGNCHDNVDCESVYRVETTPEGADTIPTVETGVGTGRAA